MEIFYTGEAGRKLMTVFHAGNESRIKRTGIIICNPLGLEYIRFYKTVSVLARELSQQGYSTCRFDYYGSGDSYGDESEMNVLTSMEDLELMVKEMREGGNIDKVCVIGIRYGGILSLISAAGLKVDSLILWNPLFSGKNYLQEIAADEKEYFDGSFAVLNKGSAHECLGFIYSDALVAGLRKFDLRDLPSGGIEKILVIADKEFLKGNDVAGYAFFKHSDLQVKENSVSRFWLKQKEEQDKSLVPVNEIKQITDWLKAK